MIAFDQEQPDNVIAMPQKNNEWYTPAKYIEAAREVMGSIDLDPASCKEANRTVKATRYYTQEDNGLMFPWYGNVFLNPPYGKLKAPTNEGRSYIGLFIRKLLREYDAGNVSQAILVATAQTDATWFHLLFSKSVICFSKEHVKFDCTIPTGRRDGKATHRLGTIFIYLGSNFEKFIEVFSEFGAIAKRVSTLKEPSVTLPLWEGSIS